MLQGITIALGLLSLLMTALSRKPRLAPLRRPGWLCYAGCLFGMLLMRLPWTHMLFLSLLLTSLSAWSVPREL